MNDRARGALLGLAVGDALGTTYEFKRIKQPAYPALATSPATDVVGGGPFSLKAGQITDDTQMAVCLARSLTERGTLDVEDVGRRYVAWMDEAFDVGNQTRGALSGLADGDRSAGRAYWRRNDHRPAGNGSLMRTAPIGVAYASRPPEALVDAAIAESLITHADPRCLLACAGFDAAIAAGVRDGADALAMRRAAQSGMHLATQSLRAAWQDEERIERELLINGRMELELDLAAAVAPDPHGYSDLHAHLSGGFVRVAFRIAFWHLVNTPSWRDAVVDVASRGGDADTNAAITGALLGARDGENAIPEEWRLRVLSATQPGSPGWADAHHPRHFLTLVK